MTKRRLTQNPAEQKDVEARTVLGAQFGLCGRVEEAHLVLGGGVKFFDAFVLYGQTGCALEYFGQLE